MVHKRCATDARPISDLSDILKRFATFCCGCRLNLITNIFQIIYDVCIHDLEEFIENVWWKEAWSWLLSQYPLWLKKINLHISNNLWIRICEICTYFLFSNDRMMRCSSWAKLNRICSFAFSPTPRQPHIEILYLSYVS